MFSETSEKILFLSFQLIGCDGILNSWQEMFDLLVSLGAKLQLKNVQGLTPLTLAAKLARKDVSV